MNSPEAIALWTQVAGHALAPRQLEQIDQYLELLIEKNKVLNLTRIVDRADADVKHVADALTLLPHLPGAREGAKLMLADVGTGGGIPGVILAIARPDMHVTLIDATRKKLDAVMEMCETVGVTNVRRMHARVEDIAERFDVLTARAVADVQTLATWCARMMRRKTSLLALKGPKAVEEVATAAGALKRMHLTAQIIDPSVPQLTGHVIVKLERTH